jgi:hypothetical protein
MTFNKWLDTFLSEKGIDLETTLTAEGASGTNYIPLACLVDAIKAAPASEQRQIKHGIVRLDFYNAPVLPFFNHLAGAIAL